MGHLWWVTCVLFAVLYGATCQRHVDWGDSGMFQLRILEAHYVGPNRLAQAHPLYIALGQAIKAVPLGSLTARISVLSGLGMAVALGNLVVLLSWITRSRLTAFLLTAMFATAQTPWLLSTMAEVYTWTTAGLTAELCLLFALVRRPRWQTLAALALVNGLGWSNHNLALLPLPIYLVVAGLLIRRHRLSAAALLPAALAYLLGAGLFICLVVRDALHSGSVSEAFQGALFGNFRHAVLATGVHWQYLKWNLCFLAMNFVSVFGPLILVGLVHLRRLGRLLAGAITAIAAVHLLFLIRYPRPDMFTFSLPTLVMLLIVAALGAAALAEKSPPWRRATSAALLASVVVQPVAYAWAPHLARAAGVDVRRIRQLPFRDDLRYWLVPWRQNEDSAARFVEAAFRQAAPHGIIIADGTPLCPLMFYQRTCKGHDSVTLIESFDPQLESLLQRHQQRPVYVVAPGPTYTPAWLLRKAFVTPEGVLFRVRFPGDS